MQDQATEAQDRRLQQAAPRLADDVYSEIKKKILAGSIKSGTKLYETVLAKDFLASRTPVREALMRLQEEGLLRRQGRAYMLPEMSRKELIDLYTVRQQLEFLSASVAARRITRSGLEKLEGNIDTMEAALHSQDREKFNTIDTQFHLTIAWETENKTLFETLSNIHQKLLFRSSHEKFLTRFPIGNEEHSLILQALKRGEPTVAAAEMSVHIQGVIEFLRQLPEVVN